VRQSIARVALDCRLAQLGVPDVAMAVKLHVVACLDHRPGGRRGREDPLANHEEGRPYTRALQCIQHACRPHRIRPIVERETEQPRHMR
jgi:hypothetical protein